MERGEYASFLLHGVTGSGKTEVYIHALKKSLEKGRGGLVLVPEIALTPQTVKRFYQVFGDLIAVLVGRLTDRVKYEGLQRDREIEGVGLMNGVEDVCDSRHDRW